MYGKKAFKPEYLKSTAVTSYITEVYTVLKGAVKEGIRYEIPPKMMNRLNTGVFLFSGMKVFTALKDAELKLTDSNGHLKGWDAFKADAQKVDKLYNENYLRAERRYAIDAARAASEWERLWQDRDLFDLEYLTDNGPNVRDSHRALEHTVLPMESAFWSQYYPPNGWNCHCMAVRVPKGDKTHSNESEAINNGNAATTVLDKHGNNAGAIFRFNPGQRQVIFPEKHPYYPQHCNGAKLNVSGVIGLSKWLLTSAAERCQALHLLKQTPDYRSFIYNAPVADQYQNVFKSKSGKNVDVHQMVNENKKTYEEVLYAAKAIANDGTSVKIQPEIDHADREARKKLLPGYKHYSANPDLLNEKGIYIDVKSPEKFKNINGLAVRAAKDQNAEALITDKRTAIPANKVKQIAKRIFMDENYTKDKVHFVIGGKYYVEHR